MMNGDVITRCVVGHGSARVVIVISTDLAREAARRHRSAGAAALAMARAGAAGLLLATLTKDDERVNLQILGDGPLRGLTVDASASGSARMFVGNPAVNLFSREGTRIRLGAAVGQSGLVSVLRDLGLRDTFRGQTPLVDGEIDTDVERYLTDSEQIDSTVGCEAFPDAGGGIQFAAGILVQALPGTEGSAWVAGARQRLRAGVLNEVLAARLSASSPVPITTADIAASVLGDEAVSLIQLHESRDVHFRCPCSRERAAATLALLGDSDLANMVDTDGQGEVVCEFCRSRYEFTAQELEDIRQRLQAARGARS